MVTVGGTNYTPMRSRRLRGKGPHGVAAGVGKGLTSAKGGHSTLKTEVGTDGAKLVEIPSGLDGMDL